ncbi:MAG: isoaspartyl peptidase/L-asparaginase [Bacteroidia bacterium]|nr:isoaspartyl peptidase/L-asparaginase [Bacteroidia bacterium]
MRAHYMRCIRLGLVLGMIGGLMAQRVAIAVHGGAGNIRPTDIPPARQQQAEAYLREVVQEGYELLRSGRSALDVVEIAVRRLEDSGLFNAGRGAVRNSQGVVELDASIMDGRTRAVGAVAAVRQVQNPVSLARQVMERTRHVLIVGPAADELARAWALPMRNEVEFSEPATTFWGTVGAVALDAQGNLAAATSTGGLSGKLPGRVGDSPIPGAGTYAENGLVALSATGEGEYFLRSVLVYDIAARLRYQKVPLSQALASAFQERLEPIGGRGGVIAITPTGEVAFYFNTSCLFRAAIDGEGRLTVGTFR